MKYQKIALIRSSWAQTVFKNNHFLECALCCLLCADVSELATSIINTCNMNTYLMDYTASHPRRQLSSQSLLSEYQISQILLALYLALLHLHRNLD